MSALALLGRCFDEYRDKILFVLPGQRSLTYGQALASAKQIASAWKKAGVRKGDAIALVLANDIAFPCCYLACILGGFVAIPVNPELGAENVEFIIKLTRPALVITVPPVIKDRADGGGENEFDIEEADMDVCGAIFFTSGTTGRPKGVRHRWSSLIGNAVSFNQSMGLGSATRMYHVLPMSYMAGFLNTILSPMVAGGTIIIGPRFSPSSALDFWAVPARERADTVWFSPSIAATLVRLVRDRDVARNSISAFSTLFCGTAPLQSVVRHKFQNVFGRPLQESYGTSELLLVSAQSRAQAALLAEDVGELLPELDPAFRRDPDGRDELIIRSPFAMIDYLTDEGLVSVADSEGFVPTGDVGKLEGKVLHITDRIKDLIIRGGINIAPRTLEDIVCAVAGVDEVAVVGMPHDVWGEALVICIVASVDVHPDELESKVRRICRDRLARSHQPDKVVMMPTFPRSATGKIQKHVLQDMLAG